LVCVDAFQQPTGIAATHRSEFILHSEHRERVTIVMKKDLADVMVVMTVHEVEDDATQPSQLPFNCLVMILIYIIHNNITHPRDVSSTR